MRFINVLLTYLLTYRKQIKGWDNRSTLDPPLQMFCLLI